VTGVNSTQGRSVPSKLDVGAAFQDASGWVLQGGDFSTYSIGAPGSAEINHINNRGVSVGDYFDEGDGKVHGFSLYRGFVTASDYPGGPELSVPVDINDHGTIVGVYGVTWGAAIARHGVRARRQFAAASTEPPQASLRPRQTRAPAPGQPALTGRPRTAGRSA